MKELTTEMVFGKIPENQKMVTTKELAVTLGVDIKTIQRCADKLFDNNVGKVSLGGRPTMLFNEKQATAIKIELQNHSKIAKNGFNTLSISNDLEASLLYRKLVEYQNNRIEQLQNEKNLLESKIKEDKPKVNFYDTVIESGEAKSMLEVSKLVGIGRNKLFSKLRENGIMNKNNIPYQQYMDKGYFKVVETIYNDLYGNIHTTITTMVYQKGIDYIVNNLYGNKSE